MKSNPYVSIIIPTKNGASTITKCLQSIAEQTFKSVEVLVIDSGSEDNTIEICLQYPFVQVIQIPPHTFNHGTTRNLGISKAKGEYILLTVQDASASTNDWIEKMLGHFLDDEELVGVCGQQIVPHDADKNPHEWFRPFSKPVPRIVQINDKKLFELITPAELHSLCGWDNVNAMYRKSILLEYPFDTVSFGEDMAWAKRVILDGRKIIYDYNSRVYHYHHSTYDFTYKRSLTVLYFTYKNFGIVKEPKYDTAEYFKIIIRNFRYRASRNWITFNWKKIRATVRAYQDFMKHLSQGEDALDSFHHLECGTPPQGKQNIS